MISKLCVTFDIRIAQIANASRLVFKVVVYKTWYLEYLLKYYNILFLRTRFTFQKPSTSE